ncbi:hypothetical protein Dvina_43405 [Dactylosporangium vinaceum]|uniref:Uncharacterized protein n=1 Tax=Dactylosporangium vinaceum TaxID=53362 RepID=A0ABV5MH94_9ACTN|nr:hypothetical protein [Dactylosporangium vinaceum]UAB94871.1 hypothetical protein Dvina_43405 [Dactylosporangium vinaceum]
MSVSLILVPLVIAATAAHAGLQQGRDAVSVCQVQTRMRDANLLGAALRDTRAAVTSDRDGLVADWAGVRARFVRDEQQIWTAHFTGDVTEPQAVDIVRAIDAAYGRQVQAAVLERLTRRAPAAGLRLESRSVTPDRAVRLVFAVERA